MISTATLIKDKAGWEQPWKGKKESTVVVIHGGEGGKNWIRCHPESKMGGLG